MLDPLRVFGEPTAEKDAHRIAALLALAGLASGLLTVCLINPAGRLSVRHHQFAWYLLGGPFGAVLAACLAICKILRGFGGLLRATLLVVVSIGAYFVSFMLAGIVEIGVRDARRPLVQPVADSSISLFVGGFVGGFLILATVSLLARGTMDLSSLHRRVFFPAMLSGVLSVIGWSLGPYLGIYLWSVVHALGLTAPTETYQNALLGDTSRHYSLFVVWQTGVAILLPLILRSPKR